MFLATLQRIGCGAVVLDAAGQVLAANNIATALLHAFEAGSNASRDQLKSLLRASSTSRIRLDSEAWVMIARPGRKPLALHAFPAGSDDDPYAATVLILVDLDSSPQPSPVALRRMFNLTAAEAALAVEISRGESTADIARSKGVSLATVRTQLASVFSKTGTHRQADLVALLARIAILP